MPDLLPPLATLTAFLLASLVLAITPGPGVFYILTRTLSQGRRAGLASVAGVALGNFGNALGASLGLAAIFAVSSLAFTVVKYAGAAYLLFMGVKVLLQARPVHAGAVPANESVRKLFRDGFIVALFNPKTALFFAAFLPHFVMTDSSPLFQSIVLGLIFVVIAATTDTLYAIFAGALSPLLLRAPNAQRGGRYLSGTSLIALGVLAALQSQERLPPRSIHQ